MRSRTRELYLVSPALADNSTYFTYSTSGVQEKVFFATTLNYLNIFYNQMALCWIWDLIPPFFLHSAREELQLFILTAFWLHQCTLPSLSDVCIAATGSACSVHLQVLPFIKLVFNACMFGV